MEVIKNTEQSEESSTDLVQKLRNDVLKDFLDERYLREYIVTRYNMREVSNVKIEFAKKGLRELLSSPLDVAHYEPVLTSLRDSGPSSIEEGNEPLVRQEVDKVLMQYIF